MEDDSLSTSCLPPVSWPSVCSVCLRLVEPGVTLTWISSVVLESVSASRLRLVTGPALVREPLGLES